MVISMFLAKVLGLYLIIVSIWLLLRYRQAETVMNDMANSPGLLMLSGFMGLIFGLLIVVGHNVWQMDWTVIITLIGWFALIEAVFNLFMPGLAKKMIAWWLKHGKVMMVTYILTLILGLFLFYHGCVCRLIIMP